MKYLLLGLISGFVCNTVLGQEVLNHPAQLYIDSTGQVYTRADAPAYLFIAPADAEDKLMLVPSSDKSANPMYWDGPGSHYIVHKDMERNMNIRFRILADGFAPSTNISFESGLIFYLNKTYFVKNGAVATALAKDDMSGVSQIYISINGKDYTPINHKKTFAEEGEYTISLYAVDHVGNAETPTEYKVTSTTDAAVRMENIYFETNSSRISPKSYSELNKLVEILKKFSNVHLEIRAHTDSWGDPKYNKILSEHRAQTAVSYLVSKGIAQSRLTAKGYGETQLVNECSKSVRCSAEKHAENRRIEFVIIQVEDKN